MTQSSGKYACADCVELLAVALRGALNRLDLGPCEVCGQQHLQGRSGPLSWPQLNAILDARGLWRPKAGGEGVIVEPPYGLRHGRLVSPERLGKYVHILDAADVGGDADDEPWFTVRVVGTEPPPGSIYPAYPQSALGPYENTRETLLAREATIKENIRTMPTAEKLRLAADFVERGMSDVQAANIIKRALLEVEGTIPKVPMPEVPA
jgi:hypothetical protein